MNFHELSPGFVGINVAVISFEKKKRNFLTITFVAISIADLPKIMINFKQ